MSLSHHNQRHSSHQILQQIQQASPSPSAAGFPHPGAVAQSSPSGKTPVYQGSTQIPYTGQNQTPVVPGSEEIPVTGYNHGMSDAKRQNAPTGQAKAAKTSINNANPARGASRHQSGQHQGQPHASRRSGQGSRDASVGSSPHRTSGSGSQSGSSKTTTTTTKKKKSGILGRFWTDEDGKPASWRTDSGGGGLARRKGEKNPLNYGFNIPDRALQTPIWRDAGDLPDVGAGAVERTIRKKPKD